MSIIVATYDRSNVLRLTIESVMASVFEDWELIVVGDGCTDDSAEVVAAFNDPRIRFHNLPRNHGEQSRPNNEAVRLARGRYLAFLNHDDLWTSNHLSVAVAELEKGTAPFVHTLALVIPADGIPFLGGATSSERYEPWAFVPASTWVLCRELFEQIGPWRTATELFIAPSADWLYRAWKANVPMKKISTVTAICVLSGGRKRSYADRHIVENERWASALRHDPSLLIREITGIAARARSNDLSFGRHLTRAAKNLVLRVGFACGLHPIAFRAALLGRRGSLINRLRNTRGLPPLPHEEEKTS